MLPRSLAMRKIMFCVVVYSGREASEKCGRNDTNEENFVQRPAFASTKHNVAVTDIIVQHS